MKKLTADVTRLPLQDEGESYFPASEADLNLAQHITKIDLEEHAEPEYPVYLDEDGVFYYCVPLMVNVHRRGTLTTPPYTETELKNVWVRSYGEWSSYGYMEPPEFDEKFFSDDEENKYVYPTLSDAVKQTQLDMFTFQLDEMFNSCQECFGSGKEPTIYEEKEETCKSCKGKGYYDLEKKQ